MLQVFSATWCSACKMVKKLLDQEGIAYVVRDIDTDKDAQDVLARLQIRSIPLTYVDDANYVIGADRAKLLELAKKA